MNATPKLEIENRKSKILFVHNYPSKFVTIDLALLREKYDVREWYQPSRRINLFALTRAVRQSDLIVGWFASWHTFFPVLLASFQRRPSLLIIGGYDTANMPAIAYGSQRGGLKKRIARTTMQLATRLVTNSNYTRAEAIKNASLDANKISVIYHGLDVHAPRAQAAKEKLVITVGNVDHDNLQRKGHDAFVRAAVLLPDVPFVLIGAWKDQAINHLRSIATPNMQFTNWVSEDELRGYFARARVYVQASQHEGFGLAVAEAMWHECIPVVTRVGSLPEVVGDCGVYVDAPDTKMLADAIQRAFISDAELGQHARARIIREFPLERRRAQLFALIDALISD